MIYKTSLIDVPKAAKDGDQLSLLRYENALVKLIEGADTPLTIALQGEWGSGKTSLMNSLNERLCSGDKKHTQFHTIWVNTWEYSMLRSPEQAIVSILSAVVDQIASTNPENKKTRHVIMEGLGKVVGGAWFVTKCGVNFAAKSTLGVDNISGIGNKEDPEEFNEESVSAISQMKSEIGRMVKRCVSEATGTPKGFLFFIDDLDRIDPVIAVQILELLKNIFDLEHCIFVLAIDYEVVIKGLKPKFGEFCAANEREFRSFFDKIIQLPFSMPVASYQISNFLISSLGSINYLSAEEQSSADLTQTLSKFALLSVGTNPRSLKRLVNILSLLRLLAEETEKPTVIEKQIEFALVCIQISYPSIYSHLTRQPNFVTWGAHLHSRLGLRSLTDDERTLLDSQEEFNEPWEQTLYLMCQGDFYLKSRVRDVSMLLNSIRDTVGKEDSLEDVIKQSLQVSAVTTITANPTEAASSVEAFHQSTELKKLHQVLLPVLTPVLTQAGFSETRQASSRIQSWLKYHSVESNSKYMAMVAIIPALTGVKVLLHSNDWLIHGDTHSHLIEEELKYRGIAKNDFDLCFERFKKVTHRAERWKPHTDPTIAYRSKAEGLACYDFGIKYQCSLPGLDAVREELFLKELASCIAEIFKATRAMRQLFASNK